MKDGYSCGNILTQRCTLRRICCVYNLKFFPYSPRSPINFDLLHGKGDTECGGFEIKDDSKIKQKTNHGPRHSANLCHLPDPPWFSLQNSFNAVYLLVWSLRDNNWTENVQHTNSTGSYRHKTHIIGWLKNKPLTITKVKNSTGN